MYGVSDVEHTEVSRTEARRPRRERSRSLRSMWQSKGGRGSCRAEYAFPAQQVLRPPDYRVTLSDDEHSNDAWFDRLERTMRQTFPLPLASTVRISPCVFVLAVLAFVVWFAGSTTMAQPLDIRTFGAKGDGVADDTAAVHAAIAKAAKSGRTLRISKGTYLIKKPIHVTTHGLKIVGAGAQHTVIKAAAKMDRMLYLRGTGMVISRLSFNGDYKANYGIHAFHLNEQDSRLQFLRVYRARSHGIFLDHSQVFEISNCVSQENGGDGFYISDCNGTRISVCRSMANRGRGFCVTRTDLSGGCWLLDCNAELNACEGLIVSDMAGTPVVIERMWVETNNKAAAHGPHQFDAIRIVSRSVMLSKSRISTSGKKPVRPKFAIHLATETRLGVKPKTGSIRLGETVKGSESGATGIVSLTQADPLFNAKFPIPTPYRRWPKRPKKLMLREVSGTFTPGETVTGQTTKATALLRSVAQVSAENCVITNNWIAREDGRASVDRVKLDPGCRSNQIGRNHRMWSAGLAGIDYSDDPGSVVSGRSVTTGSGPPTRGLWPRGAFRFNRSPSFPESSTIGKDVVHNGTMEQEKHWKRYGGPRLHKRSDEQAHGGKYALKVIGSGGAGVRQNIRNSSPGKRYNITGWLYATKGAVRLIAYDGKKLHYGTTTSAAKWTKMTMSFTATNGSTPYIGAQAVGGEAVFYLDDVVCRPIHQKRSSRLVLGWVCVKGGKPGTWIPVHVLSKP